ncbi:hypothetical protein PINS_up013728 [Pythium insidiosum]|nr:hypothetical protein PINS_up013728 [Pythium insidiosum]
MTTPRAGVLPTTQSLLGEISFRRGERAANPRKGEIRLLRFTVEEGYAVLKEKIVRFLDEPPFSNDATHLLEPNVYIKASKNAAQPAYKLLERSTFVKLLRERWANITQADVDKLTDGETNLDAVAGLVASRFVFQFFVYVSATGSASSAALRRATASRIVQSTAAVAEFARSQALGPITTNHLVVTHARQSEGTPVQLPSDNTTRQAQALDAILRDAEAPRELSDDTAIIEIEIGGAWVRLRVRVSTLRLALGLPPHDIFTRGIFHGFTPVVPAATNAGFEDTDHHDDDEDMAV